MGCFGTGALHCFDEKHDEFFLTNISLCSNVNSGTLKIKYTSTGTLANMIQTIYISVRSGKP